MRKPSPHIQQRFDLNLSRPDEQRLYDYLTVLATDGAKTAWIVATLTAALPDDTARVQKPYSNSTSPVQPPIAPKEFFNNMSLSARRKVADEYAQEQREHPARNFPVDPVSDPVYADPIYEDVKD